MRADDVEALLEAPLKRLDPRQSAPLAPTNSTGGGNRDTASAVASDSMGERSRNDEYNADGNSDLRRREREDSVTRRRSYSDRHFDKDKLRDRDYRDDRRHYYSRRSRSRSRSPRRRRDRSYSRSPVRATAGSKQISPQRAPTSIRPLSPQRLSTYTTNTHNSDKRTVFVRQIGQRATERDVRELCEREIGPVVAVKLVYDRITRRHKGVAYVEFREEEAVPKALAMTGTRLLNIPLIFELTEAEKNRIAAEAAAASTMSSVSVGQRQSNDECAVLLEPVAPQVTESDISAFFAAATTTPTHLRRIILGDTTALIEFMSAGDAHRAATALDRHILCNRQVRLRVVDRAYTIVPRHKQQVAAGEQDDNDYLTPQQRAELMLKLARSRS